LFAEHLEASPLQVALSLRIQRAKRLLDSTDLLIALVAERAGFSSARRMSVAFARLYGRLRSAFRATRSTKSSINQAREK
jgi:AraC family transcriptional regulator, regulatory protein of adaptative response / methylated-DNA-[protein]-cysteine methyltransferase